MYSPQLLDHFQHPRNAGDLSNPDVSTQMENPACGDVLKLTLKIVDGRIAQIGFRAKGCVPSIACASALTELVAGKTISQAAKVQAEDLVAAVHGLPEASKHASHLAIDALKAVLEAAVQKKA